MSSTMTASLPEITPDDLLRMPDEGMGFELVDGKLKEMNVTTLSSYVAGRVFRSLERHVEETSIGWLFPEGTSYRCFPFDEKRVRRADVSFIAMRRLTTEQATAEGHCTVVPDLVVEVISPKDLAYEVDQKADEWLAAGVKLLWIVNPQTKQIRAIGSDGGFARFREMDTLTAGDVLPGFSCPVADLFRLPTA